MSAPPRPAFQPATAVVAATKTDSFADPDGDGKAEPGDAVTYDVNVSNPSATDAAGLVFTDTIDPNTTLVAGSLRVSPLAFADSYNATKGIALTINAPGVLSNDTGTPSPTATAIAAGPTAQGGTVTLNSDGSFTYTPPAGFEGADTFNYTATNGLSPNDTATVTINVDAGPAVTTTSPANGATGVAPNSNITVNFTEPVNATTGSFSVECPAGSPQTFTLSASPAAGFTVNPAADLPAGTTCTVTVFAAQITDADSFDPPDQMAADYTFSFGTKPLAVDDMRSATGNVRINTAVTGYSVLANDQSGPGTAISAFDATTANGGQVTMNTSTGTFTYDPPRGFTGTDSFNYTISNAAGSDTGTVVLTVSDMLWFVNNAAGACSVACDGRLTHPYTTLAAFDAANGTAGVGNPEAGDHVFIHTGGGSYTGPVTLENNQRVVGQGATSSISAITGITFAPDSDPVPTTGGAAPVITTTGVAQSGVLLAQNDQLHGLAFVNTTGTAVRNITGGSVGAFLMDTVSVSNTTTGGGFTFNAGGTVEATGTNTVSTGSGSALNVTNTNIGAAGLTFRSISSSGGTNNAVTLNNTGSAGGLTVTGNGSPGSGGTIQNKTGTLATQGTGLLLTSTSNVSLSWMSIQGCQNYGIRGTNVSGFTLDNSEVGTVTKNGNDASVDVNPVTGVAGEGSLRFANLTGTAVISNSTLDRGFARTVLIENDVVTALNLSVTNSTVNESLNGSNGGDLGGNTTDAMLLDARSNATINLTVTGSHFTAYRQFAIQSVARDTATMEFNISGSDFSNSNAGNANASGSLALNGSGTDVFVKFDIHDNTFRHGTGATAPNNGGAHLVAGTVTGSGKFEGKFVNNVVGVSGIADSGAGVAADALRLFASGNSGTARVTGTTHTRYLVKGNTIQRYGEVGIQFNARQGNSTIDATVLGNVIRQPSTAGAAFAGIWGNSGALPSDTNVLNIAIGSASVAADKNTLADSDPNDYDDVYLDAGSCGGCSAQLNVHQNGSDAAGATTEDKVRDVLVDDNVGPLDLQAFFTNGNIAVVPGLPQQVALLAPQEFMRPATGALYNAALASNRTRTLSGGTLDLLTSKRRGGFALRHTASDSSAPLVTKETAETAARAAAPAMPLAQPFSGETVTANVGTLPAGKSVHITFQVTVNNPFGGTNQVSNQGTVSGNNFASVQTDDPAGGGSADPTITPVLTPPDVSVKDATVAEPASGSAPAAFAVTLSHAYTHTVTVNFATASDTGGANPATSGSDYTPTSGALTFNPGQTVQTVSVAALADGDDAETNETFLVNLGGATGGAAIADALAVGTITPDSTPGTVLISELRTSGPSGADDEFVELYNNTDAAITVSAADASAGWALVKSGATCADTPVVVAVIPAGTVIPARGNYLLVGSGYSLGAYAAGDQSLTVGIEDDRNVALFSTADLANISTAGRLDAVGFGSNAGGNCDLVREGATLSPAQGSTSEYSFVRKVDKGSTQDTNDNASDFIVVSTTAAAVGSNASPTLGAPGPENSTGERGPVPCNVTSAAKFERSRLDSTAALGSAPNTVRDATAGPNAANGTIAFSRRFTNNTGGAVSQLRFRITNTLNPATTVGAADLRALGATTAVVTVNDPAACGGSAPCNVTVVGTTLEQPPAQGSGGGVNSTLGVGSISTATPLPAGASVNVRLLFGVQTPGSYHLSMVIETATAGQIGQDEWELRGNTEDGGAGASEGGCNTPPVASAGADQTIECGGGAAAVTLDGSASSDADGDALTYEWREGATVLGTTAVLNTSFAFGPHTVTLKVTDPSGDFGEDTVSVNVVDTTDPMITAPPNVSVNTGPGATSCGAFVSDETLGAAVASDGCSGSVTVTRTGVPAGNNFPVGTTIVTYTAADGHGHTKNAYQSVTVNDNTPPTVTAPANVNVNAPPNSCSVSLDPGTASAGDNCPGVAVAGTRSDSQALNAPYPVGTTTITWTATDAHGNTASAVQTVKVNDVTAPTIIVTSGAINLSPPNHSYQTFSISNLVASASDSCDAGVDLNDVVISKVTSDEEENAAGNGDGNTLNDIVIAPDCKSLQLRSERDGGGDGRVYTITLQVKDSSGNVATAVRKVFVPRTGPAVDSGVQYLVNGCNP
ncbi:MAG TPA: Ig-like domain-containing protein [Pyrinomonadaceae bacterium]|nr:Ig-like domain-containing protein [Pyrinomonadaceae bacterium]